MGLSKGATDWVAFSLLIKPPLMFHEGPKFVREEMCSAGFGETNPCNSTNLEIH